MDEWNEWNSVFSVRVGGGEDEVAVGKVLRRSAYSLLATQRPVHIPLDMIDLVCVAAGFAYVEIQHTALHTASSSASAQHADFPCGFSSGFVRGVLLRPRWPLHT